MNDQTAHDSPDRRRFLTRLTAGLGGLAALVGSLPVLGALVEPLLRKPNEVWRSVAPVGSLQVGDTILVSFEDPSPLPWSGKAAETGAWLRRTGAETFIAFSLDCAHLGCPVRWVSDARLFMCPCHGGVYYEDGTVAAGPPKQALARYPVRVRDGSVEIRTSPLPLS